MGFRDELKQEFVTGNIVTQDRMYELIDSIPEKFSSRVDFPATGDPDKLYIALDEYKIYYWNGTSYTLLGGGGINVVQETGQSEEDVMSQKATTDMIIDPNIDIYTNPKIKIGTNTKATSSGFSHVLIGANGDYDIGDSVIAIGCSNVPREGAGDFITIGINASNTPSGITIGHNSHNNDTEYDKAAIVIGHQSLSMGNNILIGNNINNTGDSNIAIGELSVAGGNGSIAIGRYSDCAVNNSVVLGVNSSATDIYSVALGSYSKATEPSTVSVGDGTENEDYGTRKIVNVKDPTNAQDAATKTYVDNAVSKAAGSYHIWQPQPRFLNTESIDITNSFDFQPSVNDVSYYSITPINEQYCVVNFILQATLSNNTVGSASSNTYGFLFPNNMIPVNSVPCSGNAKLFYNSENTDGKFVKVYGGDGYFMRWVELFATKSSNFSAITIPIDPGTVAFYASGSYIANLPA